MNTFEFERGNKKYKRVNETKFVNMYIKGELKGFIICANKVHPLSDFAAVYENKKQVERIEEFGYGDRRKNIMCYINNFRFYNCGLYETGYYPSFYVEI